MMMMITMQTVRILILSLCLHHHHQVSRHLLRKRNPPPRAQMVMTCLPLLFSPCGSVVFELYMEIRHHYNQVFRTDIFLWLYIVSTTAVSCDCLFLQLGKMAMASSYPPSLHRLLLVIRSTLAVLQTLSQKQTVRARDQVLAAHQTDSTSHLLVSCRKTLPKHCHVLQSSSQSLGLEG